MIRTLFLVCSLYCGEELPRKEGKAHMLSEEDNQERDGIDTIKKDL